MVDSIRSGSVLVLGDGNFSFSVAFCRRCKERNGGSAGGMAAGVSVVTTVLDTEMEHTQRYTASSALVQDLKERGVSLLYGVDATRLDSLHDEEGHQLIFDHIIFNFPHAGGKSNLRRSRQLLLGVFKSVPTALTMHGRFYLTLASGQSGLQPLENNNDIENLSAPPAHSLDSWQPLHLAGYAGLVADERRPFLTTQWASYGYACAGYKNTPRRFHVDGSETLIFRRAADIACVEHLDRLREEFTCNVFHSLRPYFIHDISFWIPDSFDVGLFIQTVRQLTKGLVKRVTQLPQYCCTEETTVHGIPSTRESLCFRMIWQSVNYALTRESARDLQLLLRERLVETMREDYGCEIVLR